MSLLPFPSLVRYFSCLSPNKGVFEARWNATPEDAGTHKNSKPEKAGKSRKTPEKARKSRKTPEKAGKRTKSPRRKKPQNAGNRDLQEWPPGIFSGARRSNRLYRSSQRGIALSQQENTNKKRHRTTSAPPYKETWRLLRIPQLRDHVACRRDSQTCFPVCCSRTDMREANLGRKCGL